MKTFSLKAGEIKKNWVVIDAEDVVVGRLAAQVAAILRGKTKPEFTPNLDCGDNVVVINAAKAKFTGKKEENKKYYRHTGFPGGIKETSPVKLRDAGKSEMIIKAAVKRMLPSGTLGRQQFKNLRVYADAQHQQEAQKPVVLDFAAANKKNKR